MENKLKQEGFRKWKFIKNDLTSKMLAPGSLGETWKAIC